jgi:plastocyanin
MKRWTLSMIGVVTLLSIGLIVSSAMADQDKQLSVSVAFGRGLNTAQPGNAVNHAILPDKIKVKQGGVVHFLVSGFHQISVYNPGTESDDIVVPPPPPPGGNPFIDDPINRFYQGINPAGGPLGTPGSTNPSNAANRVESVSFAAPGTYLVICNVRGHFLDGMFALIKVKEDKDEDDDD